MKKSVLAMTIVGTMGVTSAHAASLLGGDFLTIETGSNFVMGGGAYGPAVPILGESGIIVGPAAGDTGTGSHVGPPAATDVGGVTRPWNFFSNTGYDYFSSNGSGSFGGDTTNGVDMTAWTVTWNTLANIPMGGCFLVAGGCTVGSTVLFFDTGIGTFNWDGTYGGAYTITYTAHVPIGDPSNFGGVQYDLTLTGHVLGEEGECWPNGCPVPVPAALWLFGSGILGLVGIGRKRHPLVRTGRTHEETG